MKWFERLRRGEQTLTPQQAGTLLVVPYIGIYVTHPDSPIDVLESLWRLRSVTGVRSAAGILARSTR